MLGERQTEHGRGDIHSHRVEQRGELDGRVGLLQESSPNVKRLLVAQT